MWGGPRGVRDGRDAVVVGGADGRCRGPRLLNTYWGVAEGGLWPRGGEYDTVRGFALILFPIKPLRHRGQ